MKITHEAVGEIVALMARSPIHRDWYIADIGRLILPPLKLDQFAEIRHDGSLVAWGSWAWLGEGAEQGFITGERKIQPADWIGGDRLWLIDVIAPFGQPAALCRKMRGRVREQGYNGPVRFRRNSERYSRVNI